MSVTNDIFSIIENGKEEYDDEIRSETRWEFFYHLSRLRKAALIWYPIDENARVLEIGCGFGAMTGLLCDKAAFVDAVDQDGLCVAGCKKRYANRKNLSVFQANIIELQTDQKYDLIIAAEWTETLANTELLLEKVQEMLTPEGVFLLGFRNRFGLKYSCGAIDEFVNNPGDAYDASGLHSQSEITEYLIRHRFSEVRAFYPLPDFGFTQAVYTDEWLPEERIRDRIINYDPFGSEGRGRAYLNSAVFDTAIQEGLFPQTANVVLLESRKAEPAGQNQQRRILRAILSSDREKEHAFTTIFFDDETVEKRAIFPEGNEILKTMCDHAGYLSSRGISVVPHELKEDTIMMPLVQKQPLLEYIREQICNGPESIMRVFIQLKSDIVKSSAITEKKNPELPDEAGTKLETGLIDMIPYNAFWNDSEIIYYDQEFRVPNCPVNYIMYRAIRYTWQHIPELSDILPIDEMKSSFSISQKQWEQFTVYEDAFTGKNRNRELFAGFYRWTGSGKRYRIGLVMGVFDLFHVGHLNLLRRAKEECDYLRAGVLSDDLVYKYKNIYPQISCEDRMEILKAVRYVDEVVRIEGEASRLDEWRKRPFDCFFSGDDYIDNEYWKYEKNELNKLGATIEFFPYTKGISSSMIREKLSSSKDDEAE